MNLLNPKALRHFILLLFVIGMTGLVLTHHFATEYQHEKWQQKLKNQASLASQEVDYELAKFEQIPNLLSHDPRLLSAVELGTPFNGLNKLLENWLKQSLADTIYVHDNTGLVIASSNYQQADSFVGSSFSFRPYFQDARRGQAAQYVGLGIRSNKRGYFFSSPLWSDGGVIGVITVKVNLEQLEKRLAQNGTDVLIADKHNVVFMSNLPEWRYKALFSLSDSARNELTQTRQYGDTLPEYNGEITGQNGGSGFSANHLLLSQNYLAYPTQLLDKGFRVIALVRQNTVLAAVVQADVVFLILYALIALIALAWFQTLVNKARLASLNVSLEEKVLQRTIVLSESNNKLQQTIRQYEHSQQQLKQTQQELTQAAKLALLGELSASINHEINQPLAALRTYTENSQRLMSMERYPMVEGNLDKMLTLNDTIAEVIARLKVFTRKTDHSTHNEVSILHDAVHNATSILSSKLIKQGVTLKVPDINRDLRLAIHSVELEQVLINILHNAAQAMDGYCIDPLISIAVKENDTSYDILISDNGPGMSDEALAKVFDPFFTTKPEGLGLGLTISKRILESYQGSLSAFNRNRTESEKAGGMTFVVTIPVTKRHQNNLIMENDHA
ncbi:COG4191 Signal transduction histidine kinase regulating C4-dicarboxylate transport system [Vibrio sp. B1FLJ16]|uniref:sensor histidine kinase n=1 Tax=Vibrio sp. B1FLJ16 TaxID=2751178 RepID=UPI0015F548A4|nr:ATP-binding protein [Vibrio sp. B1FLJ16]CAD7816742.1 COG4191 Signal transduction histidine kinase regulating C4-dicarboxylate transport system [Vibrio sp. B1FLJ16]CAE6929246.1 COG4191 Signal transduction histidine kinase regulating C4-dicarboxylate transport system [Vibrio sp. B1FLJ16]